MVDPASRHRITWIRAASSPSDIRVIRMSAFSISGLLNVLIIGLFLLCQPALSGSVDLAHAHVQASYAALQSAERDYRQRRLRGELPVGETRDYESYIAQLRSRFFGACSELAQFPDSRIERSTPCPSRLPPAADSAGIDQTREQTQGERSAALNQQLDAALSDFDEMLLREQERVKAATPARTGAGQSAAGAMADGDASGGMATDRGLSSGEMATAGNRGDGSVRGTRNGATAAGLGHGGGDAPPGRAGSWEGRQQTVARGVPPDLRDGSDDDVVARQLREAAEKETDPALRARLWEEYRKYKRGTQ